MAESFVGGVLISLPLLVEDGVLDIADHFLAVRVAGLPVWLLGNLLFTAVMTWGLLYWADFREVWNPRPLFGLLPRRLVGVLGISLITATLTMTMWGRVEWSEPLVAFARDSVIWTAAFGAALGDILPGESRGPDLQRANEPQEVRGDGGRPVSRNRPDRTARQRRGGRLSPRARPRHTHPRTEKGTRLISGGKRVSMPFVTRLTFRSGDSDRLESVVSTLKTRAERKGVQLRGPHAEPPSRYRVPQHKGVEQGRFDAWGYTVYTRVIEVVDHNEFARQVAERDYPDSIHVSADVEQFSSVGNN